MGFYEYGKALEHFDRLLQSCDEEELKVIDQIIKSKDEFTVYTNLSRGLQRRNSSLAEKPKDRSDSFERRGLAHVVALARVELGAMLAGFTNVMSPFAAVRPSQYEMTAYKELLEDGMRSHAWSLMNDPSLKRIATGIPNHKTVAYVRRLTVARAFLEAAGRIGRGQHTQLQLAELNQWKSSLDELHYGLVTNIETFLGSFAQNNTTTKISERDIRTVGACGKQLAGEKYELQRGTATITTETFDN